MTLVPLHPLQLDSSGRRAELAGVAYQASAQLQAKDGRVVVYLTEATQPEHIFKFIGPLPDCSALQQGALYGARLGENGHGRWLPLVPARQGFLLWDAQLKVAEVLSRPADAARRAGASRIEGLFGVQARPDGGQLQLCDRAGASLVWREALGDAASLSFSWQGDLNMSPAAAYASAQDIDHRAAQIACA
ncbi:alkaline phosphatase PhoX [Methyloversatilis sp.]|uniref:alkaline phosphatase PhoX n=1 Tax=Methyloversatilis sp. TaxID=2569862 RepID=UPI0035ADDBD3